MSIFAPESEVDTAPTPRHPKDAWPTCESYIGVGPDAPPCTNPAEFLVGVEFDCCDTPRFVEHQYTCGPCCHDDRCVDCAAIARISEPVRLRVATER